MYLRMGNLTVARLVERIGAVATDDEIAELEQYRTNNANKIPSDRFHVFDDPAISILIGADCFKQTEPTWRRINDRKPFDPPVSFFPAPSSSDAGAS